MTINKWGALASLLLVLPLLVAPLIYLTVNINHLSGILAYDLADFLSGPFLAACLISVIYILRECIGSRTQRRLDLALLASLLATVGMAGIYFSTRPVPVHLASRLALAA